MGEWEKELTMTTAHVITIQLTSEQQQRLKYIAETNDFQNPDEYVQWLVESIIEEPTKEEILEDLRISLREAFSGQTIPASELYRLLNEDDE